MLLGCDATHAILLCMTEVDSDDDFYRECEDLVSGDPTPNS